MTTRQPPSRMNKSELRLLRSFAAHCRRVLERLPAEPLSRDTRTLNAARLARHKELSRVERLLDRLEREAGGLEQPPDETEGLNTRSRETRLTYVSPTSSVPGGTTSETEIKEEKWNSRN